LALPFHSRFGIPQVAAIDLNRLGGSGEPPLPFLFADPS
jgi:hypothetical protein